MLGEDYTIADVALFPWINYLLTYYEASELVSIASFQHVTRVTQQFLLRPAVIRGMVIPKRAESG